MAFGDAPAGRRGGRSGSRWRSTTGPAATVTAFLTDRALPAYTGERKPG
ncbi:hypothetical protein ACIBKY_09070 [Nonomuraea sp. NPDC050394]